MKKRALLYARVSTNKDQKVEVQMSELRRYAELRQCCVVGEISDDGFTGKNDKRPGLKKFGFLVAEKSHHITSSLLMRTRRR